MSSPPPTRAARAGSSAPRTLEGKWELEEKIGEGGMGAVYRARDVKLDRVVAVKVLSENLSHSPELVARFEREARVMAKLEHPNLVPIYSVGVDQDAPFIVMKYLEGKTLRDYVREKGRKLSSDELLAIMRQVCAGLAFVHAKGLIHRDIKPANIFVGPDGHVTILDLGVTRSRTEEGMTRSGMLVGTPAYMSPEQIVGARDIDHRSDLYALGVILFELATGQRPFDGDSDFAVMDAHRHTPPPDPTRVAGEVSPSMASVITRSLAKKREERFQSGDELYIALETALRAGRSVRAPGSSRRVFAIGALAVAIVVGGAAAGWFTFHRPAGAPPASVSAVTATPPVTGPVVPPPPAAAAIATTPVPEPAHPPVTAPVTKSQVTSSNRPEPTPKTGQLRIVTQTGGAMTWAWLDVDGNRAGTTPLLLKLPAGRHEIRLSREGFLPAQESVRVQPGQTAVVKVELRK